MQARLQLAALDHNHNVDRDLAKDKDDNPIVRQVFSKARKDWILRQVYDKKQYGYLDELLTKIIARRHDVTVRMDESTVTKPRKNIATTERPDRQCAIQQKYSRMHNTTPH